MRLPVHQPRRVKDDAFVERLGTERPDVVVVVAYGRILPPRVLGLAPHGAINVHFSLLPAYRGAAPVQWALARGETRTGVTTMRLNPRMDEGDVLLQRATAIGPDEHAPALQVRLARIGAELLVETLDGLAAGRIVARPQDHRQASAAPLLGRRDGEVDPARSASDIAGRVRGFDPWPGVWLAHHGRRVRVVDARVAPDRAPAGAVAGTVLGVRGDALEMACGGGGLLLLERLQPEGRRAMSGRDLVNGRFLSPGDRMEQLPADDDVPADRG